MRRGKLNMVYNLNYDISALIIIVLIVYMYFSKKNVPLFQNRFFVIFLTFSLFSTLSDILHVLALNNRYEVSFFVLELAGFFYFLFHNSITFIFALYAVSLTGKRVKNYNPAEVLFIFVPFLISFIVILSTPFTDAAFYYDDLKNYFRGNFQFILYISSIYYILFGVSYCTIFRKLTSRQVRLSLYSFPFIGVIVTIIQIFNPWLLIENFGISITAILIYMTIQKPEELLDATTEVFNRMSFLKVVEVYLMNKEKFDIITVSIDDAMLLNRAFGVENMNDMLKKVALFLEENKKRNVYYLNGCRFAMVIRNKKVSEIEALIKKIENRFNDKWAYADIEIRLSSHMCLIRCPEDADNIDTVLEYAEYSYKIEDSNNWMLKAKDISLKDKTRYTKVDRIVKQAIENESFEVFYQPIYSTKEKKIVSAEALARLYDDELGFIPPDEFIPLAEKNGSIIKIGSIIFEKVCSFIKESDLNNKGIKYVEINLSVVQCVQENLAGNLLMIMKEYGIDNSRINLEITETATINSPQMLVRNMKNLYENGVHFSLDDFGTGYSNMNSLVDLPFDMIKIDKGIIKASTENDKAKVVLWSSIAMIKKMEMEIVAEGIETKEQAVELTKMGCDYLQGYYISMPLPEEKFIEFLNSGRAVEII